MFHKEERICYKEVVYLEMSELWLHKLFPTVTFLSSDISEKLYQNV